MAVDKFLSTAPRYYRPETREGEIGQSSRSRVRGSRVAGRSANRVKELRISCLPGPSTQAYELPSRAREPRPRTRDMLFSPHVKRLHQA